MKQGNSKLAQVPQYNTIAKGIKTSVLARILQDLHSAPHLQQLLINIDQIVKEEFHCEAVLISLYDSDREELIYYSLEPVAQETEFRLKLGHGLAGKVGATQAPVLVDSLEEFPDSMPVYENLGTSCQQILACPLIRRGTLMGVIEVLLSNQSGASTQGDLLYLTVLSHQIAMALNFFKLSDQAVRTSLEEEKLEQVSQRISSSLDLDELLDLIIDVLRSLVPCDAAGIYLLDRNGEEIQRMVVYGYEVNTDQDAILNLGRGATQLIRGTGAAIILRDLSQYPLYIDVRGSARSALVAPILSNNRLIGVFTLECNEQDVYTRNDLALFQKFAHQAALSIEKAQLHQALIEKNKLERELSIARDIQQSFLPRSEPRISGFEVAGLNLPSRLVSGDYYDFIKIVEGQWGLVIGDVSGKGIPASLIMASFRASLLAEIRNNYSIRTIMSKVNRLLWESTDANQFVTAFYGVLDESRRILTYCNAGHNPVLLIRQDGSWIGLETGGLVLGAFAQSTYQESYLEIRPDDVLLLYTDGVTEIYDQSEEEFGVDRLLELVKSHRHLSAKELTSLVQEEILEFALDKTIQDDFTIVILKATAR
jgi:serine phosphatase RsbU (regulator of sigma subunit)